MHYCRVNANSVFVSAKILKKKNLSKQGLQLRHVRTKARVTISPAFYKAVYKWFLAQREARASQRKTLMTRRNSRKVLDRARQRALSAIRSRRLRRFSPAIQPRHPDNIPPIAPVSADGLGDLLDRLHI